MPKYRKSPLVEVVAEVRFLPTGAEDATLIGLVYNALKNDFPTKSPGYVLAGPNSMFAEERTQFFTADRKVAISIAPTVIAVSHFQPYETWNKYRPYIQQGIDAYVQASGTSTIQRIGLRYVNKITIEAQQLDLDTVLNFSIPTVPVPEDANAILSGYLLVATYPKHDDRDVLKLQINSLAVIPPSNSEIAFAIDLDYSTVSPGSVSVDGVMPWFEEAHAMLERYFEAIVKDELKSRFEPYE